MTLLLACLAACTQITRQTLPPQVSLASVTLKELGIVQQTFLLELRLQNPNDHPINIRGLDFQVDVNGEALLGGATTAGAVLPKLGENMLQVEATSTLSGILRQLQQLQPGDDLEYRLRGHLKLDGIVVPIPFEYSGSVPFAFPGQPREQPRVAPEVI